MDAGEDELPQESAHPVATLRPPVLVRVYGRSSVQLVPQINPSERLLSQLVDCKWRSIEFNKLAQAARLLYASALGKP
jgi:hypothetical protein